MNRAQRVAFESPCFRSEDTQDPMYHHTKQGKFSAFLVVGMGFETLLKFGGPVWICTVVARTGNSAKVRAGQLLIGVGDRARGEWLDGPKPYQGGLWKMEVRRRLTLQEEARIQQEEERDDDEDSVRGVEPDAGDDGGGDPGE